MHASEGSASHAQAQEAPSSTTSYSLTSASYQQTIEEPRQRHSSSHRQPKHHPHVISAVQPCKRQQLPLSQSTPSDCRSTSQRPKPLAWVVEAPKSRRQGGAPIRSEQHASRVKAASASSVAYRRSKPGKAQLRRNLASAGPDPARSCAGTSQDGSAALLDTASSSEIAQGHVHDGDAPTGISAVLPQTRSKQGRRSDMNLAIGTEAVMPRLENALRKIQQELSGTYGGAVLLEEQGIAGGEPLRDLKVLGQSLTYPRSMNGALKESETAHWDCGRQCDGSADPEKGQMDCMQQLGPSKELGIAVAPVPARDLVYEPLNIPTQLAAFPVRCSADLRSHTQAEAQRADVHPQTHHTTHAAAHSELVHAAEPPTSLAQTAVKGPEMQSRLRSEGAGLGGGCDLEACSQVLTEVARVAQHAAGPTQLASRNMYAVGHDCEHSITAQACLDRCPPSPAVQAERIAGSNDRLAQHKEAAMLPGNAAYATADNGLSIYTGAQTAEPASRLEQAAGTLLSMATEVAQGATPSQSAPVATTFTHGAGCNGRSLLHMAEAAASLPTASSPQAGAEASMPFTQRFSERSRASTQPLADTAVCLHGISPECSGMSVQPPSEASTAQRSATSWDSASVDLEALMGTLRQQLAALRRDPALASVGTESGLAETVATPIARGATPPAPEASRENLPLPSAASHAAAHNDSRRGRCGPRPATAAPFRSTQRPLENIVSSAAQHRLDPAAVDGCYLHEGGFEGRRGCTDKRFVEEKGCQPLQSLHGWGEIGEVVASVSSSDTSADNPLSTPTKKPRCALSQSLTFVC
jgi:hypothetical protein